MTQSIHILGVCGTFMGGIAQLAKASGYEVSGSDQNVYPPMSTQLEQAGIPLYQGFELSAEQPDTWVIGNAMSRGNPAVERILNRNERYVSGPQWLSEHVLQQRWVLGIAGTHGKTTTSSMVAWILEYAKLAPGFLIGGVPANFGQSARLGEQPFFVVEADEYDTAFFDKRSKFVHYHPRTLILNNLEYDHADIFPDIDAIITQFHHLVRTVPEQGLIIYPEQDANIQRVLNQGCWSNTESIGPTGDWWYQKKTEDGSHFNVFLKGQIVGEVQWELIGEHNILNALAAVAAARHAGVPVEHGLAALAYFKNVARRMELKLSYQQLNIYDDFAHHPTAIATTLAGLRAKVGNKTIIAVMEPRSNTMKMGIHQDTLLASFDEANEVILYQPPELDWDLEQAAEKSSLPVSIHSSIDSILDMLMLQRDKAAEIIIMSNGSFGGLHERLVKRLVSGASQ
ncbi:MAG: UDP-N-acetylmuramate:L-alanyl-gamma-D-glutamyl-meso-diaminopimelate ligase [Kangiellaceae bacterium]|nr:UDP-N-acetylmuramate:L-alanyl-gamma-D-glutamyl-meso-diaminopimelate ligase [Kangiellaceae bacterium]|tara:strand:- start:16772 stop:18136 length:1365 start_codon:yes stop_codon:yes gene_type:complete